MARTKREQNIPAAIDSILDYPPFPGFDKKAFTFLKGLKKNNDRDWFNAHKETYQDHIVEPIKSLLAELHGRFLQEGIQYSPDPKTGMFRIYRDTRFSKDKLPYKTNASAIVPFRDELKKGIGNYLHIEPGGCFYGGGLYFMESDDQSYWADTGRDAEAATGWI